MAERRMFTKKVTDDDNFFNLSSSAQALYLHLSMGADDDGFCNQVAICMFRAHATTNDLQQLLEKRFIYQFENGVIVIKHWRMANALRKDRYTPTAFQEELKMLSIKDNGSYTMAEKPSVATWLPDGCQTVATCLPQDSIGKVSIGEYREGEDSIGNTPPLPPTGEPEQKPSNKSAPPVSFDLDSELAKFNWSDEMKDLVKSFFEYRKEIKKPLKSARGIKSLLKELDDNIISSGEGFVDRCINKTMANGWQGIFYKLDDSKPQQAPTQNEYLERLKNL